MTLQVARQHRGTGHSSVRSGGRAPAHDAARLLVHQAWPSSLPMQPTLTVGPRDDVYEREADRVGDQVMRMPAPPAAQPGRLQRQVSSLEEEPEDEELQLKPASTSQGPGRAGVDAADVAPPPGSGRGLHPADRAFMEPRFGHDFSRVRVHADASAAAAAQSVNARAYTLGQDIAFGAGQYAPGTAQGRRLLAHELTHVVQQGGGDARAIQRQAPPANVHEQGADAISAQIGNGEKASASRGRNPTNTVGLPRQADAGEALDGKPGCTVGPGISNSACSAYAANSWWLPQAYVQNATCACLETPNVPTANCVRKSLQDRMLATPGWLKMLAATQKPNDNPMLPTYAAYQAFVQASLTPTIYQDHVDAYAACCCPSGPAAYPAWIGVTTVPLPCAAVGAAIMQFGSCHGTPGTW